jgi:anti-sigma regulatory factor (Ser/Thr protein kinase)
LDQIVLTIPRERDFGAIANLVVAGIGSRHDFTLDAIDDLQLAVESLVEHDEDGEAIVLRLSIDRGTLQILVGPFDRETIAPELASDRGELGLRRVLAATVDEVGLTEQDGASWIELRKRVTVEA